MRKSAINKVRKLVSKIDDIVEELNELLEAEQEYFDERSEAWQESETGEEFSDKIYKVEELRDALENASYDISDIVE